MSLWRRVARVLGLGRRTSPREPGPETSASRATRLENLRRSLKGNLDVATIDEGLGPRDRAVWLIRHLGLYVGRCVGFAALPQVGTAGVHGTDLFDLVEIGTEMVRGELDCFVPPAAVTAAWATFLSRLEAVRAGGEFGPLQEAADAVLVAFGETPPGRGRASG